MNRLLTLVGGVLLLSAPPVVKAGTLFTNPVIVVMPMTLDFGAVADKVTATNTFVVENMGGAKLTGKATVPAPFKILSGGDYTLRANEAQVVTVTYTPSGAASDTQAVTFTGGSGITATVTGKLAVPPANRSKRK
jgi:hypothetical protein